MFCVLCLSVKESYIEIFEEGTSLHIDEIIKKHFWLQPSIEDRIGRVICTSCWQELSSFHEFYVQIEKVHYDQLNAIQNSEYTYTDFNSPKAPETIPSMFLESDDIKPDVREFVDIPLDENNFAVADDQSPVSELQSSDCAVPPEKRTRSLKCVDLQKLQQNTDPLDVKLEHNVEQIATTELPTLTESQPKEAKKRNRPPKPPPPKKYRSSGLQHLNAQRMREFDEIIANKLKQLTCAICNNEFPDFSALDRHSRSEHKEGGYIVCCKKKLNKRYLIVDHIIIHDDPEYFKCDTCGQVSKDRKCLRVHMRKHESTKERKFQCNVCPFKTHTRTILKRHMHTHFNERNIECPQCDKFFASQDNLRGHINSVHNVEYMKICEKDGKVFRSKDVFERHLLEHDGVIRWISCEKCDVKLKCKSGLKRHMNAMHPTDNKTEFECKECGRVLPSNRSLKYHVIYSHKLEPDKHKCLICGKGFKIKRFLKERKPNCHTCDADILLKCKRGKSNS